MYKRFLKTVSILVAILLLLTACGGGGNKTIQSSSDSDSEQTVKKDTLIARTLADPTTFDPVKSSDINEQIIHYQIHESLVREEQDGSLVPAIAEKLEFSDDALEINITLRDNVKFHNGEMVTVDDVVFSLNRSIESPFTTKVTSSMEKAEKIDDKTVLLKLKHPYAPILGCLASSYLSIVPEKVVKADPEAFEKNPVGAGAYVFKEMKSGEKIVMEAFQDYYRGPASIKHLTFRIIPDATTALIALEKGEIDMTRPSQANADRQAIMDNPDLTYHEAEQAGYFMIAFNNAKGIFSNRELREAVSYAIDRDDILDGAINGMGTTVDVAMPGVCSEYYPKDFKAHEYNIEKAKQLIKDAGYPNGFKVKAKIIGAENYMKPMEIIQEQLRQVGISVEIEGMERGAWFSDVFNGGNYEMTFYGVAIPVVDPDFATYSYFHSTMSDGKGNNLMNVKIPELDKVLEAGRTSQDKDERIKLYERFCEIVRDESILIPTHTARRTKAAKANLKGLVADPMMKYYVYNYQWE